MTFLCIVCELRRTALLALATSAVLIAPGFAEAKIFRNSYVSFELPQQWDCQLIDTEWVCRTNDPNARDKSKEAIIILTAKEVGPADNPQAYQSHLKTPRTLPSALGTPMQSTILNVTQRQINGHVWVDGMHRSSEVRDYFTRYLATVKDRIAILVTLSAHHLSYSCYTNDFFRAIESLRVLNTRGLLNATTMASTGGAGAEQMGANLQAGMPTDFGDDLPEEGSGRSGGGAMNMILGLAVILGAIGVYLLLKKKKSPSRR